MECSDASEAPEAAATSGAPLRPSSSGSVTRTVNGSHSFTITDYSLAKGMGAGKHVASDTFSAGGHKWAVYFYPDGKNDLDSSQYVSLFIALASEGTDVRALFKLTMLDMSGKGKHKVHSRFRRSPESGPYPIKHRGSMWGYKRFFRRAALEASDYLKDDTLIVTCTVGVVVSGTEAPRQIGIPIGSDWGKLLNVEEYTDVVSEVGTEVVKAHKLRLSARSPVFRALSYGSMREKPDVKLSFTDVEAPLSRALLHYMYTHSKL
eukprot:SM000001S04587  [mRNA]  locus=s1:1121153:1122554:+ [translate_table: standard]